MSRISTMLWYDSQALEAAEHYVSIVPNSRVTDVIHYGEGAPLPAGTVMTAAFELDGRPFVALNGGPMYQFNEAISLVLTCADQAEIDRYWDALVEGGEPGQCGWLKDRYGLSWQVVPDGLGEWLSEPRAMEAMMGMQKLDVGTLRAAAGV